MKPALTPEQWASVTPHRDKMWQHDSCVPENMGERHYVAAVNLYGQPFGFTHEDVENLRMSVGDGLSMEPQPSGQPYARELWDLADRIEALLPPK